VDDGSPDRSGEMCEAYARQDSRIRVLHQENQGQAVARNHALDLVTGTYIAFVDSDDCIHPQMLEILWNNAQRSGAQISVCGYQDTFSTEKVIGDISLDAPSVWSGKAFLRHCILDKIDKKPWVLWDKLFHRDCFRQVRMPVGRIYEDCAIVYQLLYNAETVADCDAELYYYYQNPESTVNKKFNRKQLQWLLVLKELLAFCEENHEEELYEHFCKSYLNQLADLCLRTRRELQDKSAEKAIQKELRMHMRAEKKKYPVTIKTHPNVWEALHPTATNMYWKACSLLKKIQGR